MSEMDCGTTARNTFWTLTACRCGKHTYRPLIYDTPVLVKCSCGITETWTARRQDASTTEG